MIKKLNLLCFMCLICFFMYTKVVFSQAKKNYPGTPSSSYNFNYNFPTKKIKNKDDIVPKINFEQKLIKVNNKDKSLNIIVKGNYRLDSNVIIRDSEIKDKKNYSQKVYSQAIKKLFKTGYFSDVKIFRKDDIIYIIVKENPVINMIAFEGNSEIDDDAIKDEISLKNRNIFSKSKVKSDVLIIQTLYKRLGFFSTYIEPKIIKLDQNRINLVFEISEGLEAKIKKINFIGNKEFSDSTLRDVIFSEESRWYKFFGSGDKFDQDKIDYDQDLLKRYYYNNGFIDFRIVSASSKLVGNRKSFIINFKVFEGKRYKVNEIEFEIANKELQTLNFKPLLETEKGDWFSSKKLEKDIESITNRSSELGFAFVDIRPKLKKDKNGKVTVIFIVYESERIYVNRINIKGNFKSHDKVIRREIQLAEGDAFNLSKLEQSERRIKSLALFESVKLNYEALPKTNKTNIEVEVTETSTGEFSVGAGFSSLDGALGNVGIKESNLLGQGKELSLNLGVSTRRSSIDMSYTEPYTFGKDIATGIDIFNIRQNNKTYSGYKHNMIGFKLRSGYEIFDDLRHFSSYTLRSDKIHDISSTTSKYILAQQGKAVTSMIGQAFQYDKLNDRINPTDGYRIRFDADFYGLGGNTDHIMGELQIMNFTKIFETTYIANFLELGHLVKVDKDIKINNRFNLTGDQIRGFKNSGLGPRDTSTGDSLGGEQFLALRNELHFPIGLPESLGVTGLIFGDAGTLFNVSDFSTSIKDEMKIRASAGFGISWNSPFGPVKIYLSKAIIKASYDKSETFRFSFGTTY